jgi:hypothetical protein
MARAGAGVAHLAQLHLQHWDAPPPLGHISLSLTHTPGTQAPAVSLSMTFPLSHSLLASECNECRCWRPRYRCRG